MLTKEMTKSEILKVIEMKLRRLKPRDRTFVLSGLKYHTKSDLLSKARNMKVEIDRDGYDVLWRGH